MRDLIAVIGQRAVETASKGRERLMSKLSSLSAIALFVCPITNSLGAQERAALTGPNSQRPPYPDGALIKFQWNYSCPNHKGCSFSCPGGGGADHVTKLDIYLGGVFDAADGLGLFYSFATDYVSSGTGFSVSKGAALSCHVVGMRLDYSGPLKENAAGSSKN
jgi:hypothetical protein